MLLHPPEPKPPGEVTVPCLPHHQRAQPHLHSDPTDPGQQQQPLLQWVDAPQTQSDSCHLRGKPFKEGTKERSKGHLYTRAEQRLHGSVRALASLFGSNNLCASSGGFTLKFSALYYRVCPPGALETCGCSAIKDSPGLKRSPYHTSLMGCTSFQVTHEQYQSISSAIPFFICFLRFFPLLFRADIPTRKEGEEVTKTPILHFIIYSFQSTPIKPFSGCYSLSIK